MSYGAKSMRVGNFTPTAYGKGHNLCGGVTTLMVEAVCLRGFVCVCVWGGGGGGRGGYELFVTYPSTVFDLT